MYKNIIKMALDSLSIIEERTTKRIHEAKSIDQRSRAGLGNDGMKRLNVLQKREIFDGKAWKLIDEL